MSEPNQPGDGTPPPPPPSMPAAPAAAPAAPPATPAGPPPYVPAATPAGPPPYVPAAPAAAPPPYVPGPQVPGAQPVAYPQPGQHWGPQTGPQGEASEAVPAAPRKSRAGLWLGLGLGVAALLIAGGAVAVFLVVGNAQAEDKLAAARELSFEEQNVVRTAVTDATDVWNSIYDASFTYQEAAADWADAEASATQFQSSNDTPSQQAPNPGGSLPDGYGRDLLASIGAGDVQVMLDAGEQNCGYDPRGADWIAVGGCYNPTYRDWFFLAWEPGTTDAALWSIFVHEAMHWQQWDQLAVYYESASIAGIGQDQYRKAVESDASCRAVYQHGVPIEDYVSSSSPCDVDGWTPSYLPDYLASLGVPMAAPDPEAYEVQEVIRP